MPTAMSDSGSPNSPGHSRRRLLFVVCCIVAVAAGGILVGSVSSGDLAGSPIDSILPGESLGQQDVESPGATGAGGDSGQLGALSPGAQTGVGGELGLDNDTFGSTDTEIHFIAESSQPTYWRTAAYDTYTGSGWERTTETEPYEPPIHDTGFEQIEYNISLQRPAGALPTPWQPTAVGGIDDDQLVVGEDGSIQPVEPLESGSEFTGVSHKPQDDPELLRNAGDSHPSEIDRYTELPEDVPPRLAVQTENIIGDADSRYDAAVAVQNWLRGTKDYSLEAYQQSDTIADTFVFEMEAGYCEYFATAMATMLRTQDIPTRYAVGYSSGQQVGDDVYQVRGMNAHAWVEVYFEGVGWVQFDPTPAGPRLETQGLALEEIGEEYDVEDPGSPGEVYNRTDIDPDESEGWALDLNRTATPGTTVEVTVTYDGTPVPGAELTFNDEPVGVTDEAGTVTGTVPSADEFEIRIVDIDPETVPGPGDVLENETFVSGGSTVSSTGLAGGTGPALPTLSDTDDDIDRPADNGGEPVYNETIDIETDPEIEISGEILPGNEVGLTVRIGDEPIPDAAVRVDGEERARTDEAGWTTVTLPSSTGTVTITVESDSIEGERVVDIPSLDVEVETALPLALPFGSATVEASYGNDSAVGVPVEVNGETVTATGPDGEATVRLPVAMSADIVAAENGVSAGTTVGFLLVNLLVVMLVPVALLGAVAVMLARRGYSSRADLANLGGSAVRTVREALGELDGLTTRLLVAVAGRGDTLLREIATAVRETVRLLLVTVGLKRSQTEPEHGGWNGQQGDTTGQASPSTDTPPVTDEQATVRDAWQQFLSHVSVPATTRTPGELALHAIEHDGLPEEPVRTLRDAFRETEYGSRPAQPDQVRSALDRIEAGTGGTDTDDQDNERAGRAE